MKAVDADKHARANVEPEENNGKARYISKYYFKDICGKIGTEK